MKQYAIVKVYNDLLHTSQIRSLCSGRNNLVANRRIDLFWSLDGKPYNVLVKLIVKERL